MALNAQAIRERALELLPDAIALRRKLHAHPELGLELPETTRSVRDAIADLDLEIRESQSTTSFVATLRGGRPGKTLLLRADMDALPMPEDTGLDFGSKIPGRMHACGHDAHAAMLAGAARLLTEARDQLAGTVHFFFQTGEEGHFGARYCLEEGLFEGPYEPEAVFAIHIDPRLRAGQIATRAGSLLASADVWKVAIVGQGGHASMPHDTRDPVPVACEIVQAFQTFVTRRFDVFDPVVLTTTKIEAGTTNNVIPAEAHLLGTLRSTSDKARQRAQEGIQRIAQQIAAAHELEARVNIEAGYPVTRNHSDIVALIRDVVEAQSSDSSERRFLDMPAPVMGAEDFSYLLERWPGAMVFLGVRPPGTETPAPCHSNRMMLAEPAMAHGIALHAEIATHFC